MVDVNYMHGGSINRLFLRVDNFAMAYGRKVYDMSKVLEFYPEKKCKNCMSVQINILRLICINLLYALNYAEFDKTHGFYPILTGT